MSNAVTTHIVDDGPRQVKLAIARIDPWTVMKVSFLLSVAMGVMAVVSTAILWLMLDAMHVFAGIQDFMLTIGAERYVTLLEYVKFSKVVAYTTIGSVANVAMLTAFSTLGAFLYNVIASLVGGVRVYLMDE